MLFVWSHAFDLYHVYNQDNRQILLKSTKPRRRVPIVNQSMMGYDKCPFCNLESNAKKATSVINRHIKAEAQKSVEQRGKHPAEEDEKFILEKAARKFKRMAASKEERRQWKSISDSTYLEKRRTKDEAKIKAAFNLLQYSPHWSK